MNSLNLLSARVSQPSSRTSSLGSIPAATNVEEAPAPSDLSPNGRTFADPDEPAPGRVDGDWPSEVAPLLTKHQVPTGSRNGWHRLTHGVVDALTNVLRWILSLITLPGAVVTRYFFDETGSFTPTRSLKSLGRAPFSYFRKTPRGGQRRGHGDVRHAEKDEVNEHTGTRATHRKALSSSSESEADSEDAQGVLAAADLQQRLDPGIDDANGAPPRRSIRIKLHNEGNIRRRKHGKSSSVSTQSNGAGGLPAVNVMASHLKSPTSTAAALMITKYPHAPTPPRPLLPRRQPSYSLNESATRMQRTLILDLDETLIHSMAKGGRMSTGHMVEIKLNVPSMGPQHPILYYVHKRPYCDEFLRKVCKWYNLVIFTASVQEYADPVIDWLELERKFFSARYYRQHCTYRHGAFIKDLSTVEPDLSKVMILDNSPLSYMFHQDNAIPIEGWISDPTDSDLLNLIPLLEGLQYVTDVRAFLALRGGEDGKHALPGT